TEGSAGQRAPSRREEARGMKSMAFKGIDRLFIVVYGTKDPTDDDWWGYIEEIRRHGIKRTMQLVFTEAGGPSAPERRYLEEVLAGRTVPIAVMSGNPSVAVMVSAMSWVNREIRYFSRDGLYDALAHLEIPASRAELIEREMDKLRQSLGNSDG